MLKNCVNNAPAVYCYVSTIFLNTLCISYTVRGKCSLSACHAFCVFLLLYTPRLKYSVSKNGGAENAVVENAAADSKGGKCGSEKRRS